MDVYRELLKLFLVHLTMFIILIYIILRLHLKKIYKIILCCCCIVIEYLVLKPLYDIIWYVLLLYTTRNKRIVTNMTRNLFTNFRLINNFKDLPKENTIIIANYPSNFLEYLNHFLIPKKVYIMAASQIVDWIQPFYEKDEIISVQSGGGYKYNYAHCTTQVVEKISKRPIFTYIERLCQKKSKYRVNYIKKGMFRISRKHNIPITPICFDIIDFDLFFTKGNYRIKVGKTFISTNPDQDAKKIKLFFNQSLNQFRYNTV